jgi:hypothetical protein
MTRRLLVLAAALSAVAFADKLPPASGGPLPPDPPSICDAIAGNMLTNCGFETGDFTGWTLSGNTSFTGVTAGPFDGFVANSGTYFAFLGPIGSLGFLSQTLATTPGAAYNISFFLVSDGATPNEFDVEWGGATVFDATNIPSTGGTYVLTSIPVVATSSSTTVSFSFQNNPGYLALDDTSVVPASVPEPSSILLLTSVFGAIGLGLRRRFSA